MPDIDSGCASDGPGEELDQRLLTFVNGLLAVRLGTRISPDALHVVASSRGRTTLVLSAGEPPTRWVLKVAAVGDEQVDFQRTVTAMAMARAAGVPVAGVAGVDTAGRTGPWQYLLQEHLDGETWHRVRPMLSSAQVAACHRQIAAALLALQSVTLPGFDEALSAAPSESSDLRSVLRRRAQLRIADPARRDVFLELLDREGGLFALSQRPVLVHDDLHHANVVFQSAGGQWLLTGFLDWDKAWAGPAESDVARMALWDDMTGPAFWRVYRAEHPELPGEAERRLVHQLLWCLEYDVDTPRHRADTTAICDQLGIAPPRWMSRPAWSPSGRESP